MITSMFIHRATRRLTVLSVDLGSGSVRSSHQTVSDYTLRQWFPNTQQSRFLCRCHEKLVLPNVFDTSLSSLMMRNLHRVIQQQFWLKECDILGGQNILWPVLHVFRGQDTNSPRILRCCLRCSTMFQLLVECWFHSDNSATVENFTDFSECPVDTVIDVH